MPADIFSAAYSRPVTREGAESAPPTHDPPPPPPLHPPPSVAQSSSAPRLTQSHSTTSIATVTESASSGSINSQHQLPRRPVFGRKPASFSGSRRRSSSSTPNAAAANAVVTDTAAPPALPDYALSAAARVASREQLPDVPASPVIGGPDAFPPRAMLSRSGTSNTINMMPPPPTPMGGGSSTNGTSFWQPTDAGVVHQQITDLANKRIATLEYLRKAYVYCPSSFVSACVTDLLTCVADMAVVSIGSMPT